MSVFIVAGLGNPGPNYQWTRHNAGFLFLDRFASQQNVSFSKKAFSGLTCECDYAGQRLILLKPQTFMNLSGNSIIQALQFYKLSSTNLIVIHDEIDLPFGSVRLKNGGGHGGHNGLRSIIEVTGKNDFARIRIGIGKSVHHDTSDYVLGRIPPEEMEKLASLLDKGSDILESLLENGIAKTMSLFNNKKLLPEG